MTRQEMTGRVSPDLNAYATGQKAAHEITCAL